MITRIEIDGFKSFRDFSLDLHPFTMVVGTNASGKSNLIDAFRFLSAAVKGDLYDAVAATRGDGTDLFHQYDDESRVDVMRFAAEFLIESEDVAGEPLGTRWRYEARIGVARDTPIPDLVFEEESLRPVVADHWFDFVNADVSWRAAHERIAAGESPVDLVRRAGVRPQVAKSAQRSEHVGAAWDRVRDDLVGLRAFDFETFALGQPTPFTHRRELAPDGSGLAGCLFQLREETRTEDDPNGALRVMSMALHGVIPDVSGFRVVEDEPRQEFRVEFAGHNQPLYHATTASAGTLRTLGILAALWDPNQSAPVLIDEADNGIYPQRFRKLLREMWQSVTDPTADDPSWPLRQALVTGQSTVIVDTVALDHVIVLDVASRISHGMASRVTIAGRAAETTAKDSTSDRGRLGVATVEKLRTGGKMPD